MPPKGIEGSTTTVNKDLSGFVNLNVSAGGLDGNRSPGTIRKLRINYPKYYRICQ